MLFDNLIFYSILQLIILDIFALGNQTCDPPPILREARINSPRNQRYPVGTLLPYHCNVGYYRIDSDNLARCVTNGTHATWHLNIKCEPVNCGDPGEIENGKRIGDNWNHPNSVKYICDEGYVLNSNEVPFVRHCQASRMWSNFLPSCLIVNCSIPENPPYGSTELYGVTYGSQVIYDCGPTRKLLGNAVRECQKNGEWTGDAPRCVDLECEFLDLTYPFGSVKMLDGVSIYDKVIYKCDDGTVTEAQCVPPGIWFPPPPQCLTGDFSTTTRISTTRFPLLTSPQVPRDPVVTSHPRRRNIFCRWKIFKWICDFFNKKKSNS